MKHPCRRHRYSAASDATFWLFLLGMLLALFVILFRLSLDL